MQPNPITTPDAGMVPAISVRKPRSVFWGLRSRRWLTVLALLGCALLVGWFTLGPAFRRSSLSTTAAEALAADNLDEKLQRAATAALGERRGTVIVMDPQSGRIRVVINQEIAFEENLPPGSTVKPFTALAALRSGVIDEESRTLCREKYAHEKFHTICSHPRELSPLNPTEAIAYSCNYYFGKVGERLEETNFNSTLREFGFGQPSGVNAAREGQGWLRHAGWKAQDAIGESNYLRSTPIQLINAYATLVNGGHLFAPRLGRANGFVPELRANVNINEHHRELILRGMRGAVRYGTAETASLYSLPVYVFGKTGTATEINGFRTQGWFVGFASDVSDEAKSGAELAPDRIKLAVLVFLPRAHGSDAAEVARPIFNVYASAELTNAPKQVTEVESKSRDLRPAIQPSGSGAQSSTSNSTPPTIAVHLVRENVTRTMPLEDYVRGVVATEGSVESEPEALKALAVASRTYVLKNSGRHASDGFDVCSTTHCQRYQAADPDSLSGVSAAVVEAVESTKGQVLYDSNELADAYFSASCGGATANMGTLWGGNAPTYLRGVRDEYCETEAHHSWTDLISQQQLARALQTDPRTNVGDQFRDLRVARTDASGRAELITIAGNRRITIKGWDFKIIVGRALGWNLIKSSRFSISRSGSDYVFRGSGFGHGLGLCQEGAHVMAARGSSYRQILAKYFPSTHIGNDKRASGSADLLWRQAIDFKHTAAETNSSFSPQANRAGRRRLSSEGFHISYPGNVSQQEIERLLTLLHSSRKSLLARAAAAGISASFPVLEIFLNETTGDFVGRTGQPPWAAAASKGTRIDLQPLVTLKRRRIVETTLRHELVHTLVDIVGRGRAPRWLAEGLALHLAGEGQLVARYQPRQRLTTDEIEKQLSELRYARSANEMRAIYAAAYGEVKRLVDSEGEASVWRRVARS